MACNSNNVQTVAEKTAKAKSQINELQKMLQTEENQNKQIFFAQIDSHLANANLKDAREIGYNADIKIEYISEFSLDKIVNVVTTALKAAIKATDPLVPEAEASPDAIAAYSDVVTSVAEAAKSSASSATSLSFSMNRLSPGLYAFLYATSVNIKDVDTFGTEAVTATAIYYRFMQSIDDVKNQAKFGKAIIDAKNLIHMKMLQAALTDSLAAGEITIDDWIRLDGKYSELVKTIQARLDAEQFDKTSTLVLTVNDGFGVPLHHSFAAGSTGNQKVVHTAIQKLKSMNQEAYKVVIETSETRLANIYY